MRVLFIGDIVGTPGMNLIRRAVPLLRQREALDLVVANAENAANGSGMYPNTFKLLRNAGVDAVTLGDHIYKKADVIPILEREDAICKPANFPTESPGRDHARCTAADGTPVIVISLMGRTFMRAVDCPFAAVDQLLMRLALPNNALILVDIHAEATADKYLMAHHLNGRVTAVFGTHTHVPTADEHVMSGGTAFICDVGMTGPHNGILGRRTDRVLSAARTFVPVPFDVADGDIRLNGAIVEVEPTTGRATAIRRLVVRDNEI